MKYFEFPTFDAIPWLCGDLHRKLTEQYEKLLFMHCRYTKSVQVRRLHLTFSITRDVTPYTGFSASIHCFLVTQPLMGPVGTETS